MTVATPLGGKSDCCGGGGDCPDPGDCPDGQECLPSTYVAPCADGTDCLPSDYIDPDDCPASGPGLIESPDDITGLIGWYDASDGASFTLDGDDRVDGWTDKSGNGNDLENEGGGGAAGPLHDGATTLNGLPVVVFDTPDRRLSAPSGIDQAQPFTVFVVGASTDAFAGDFGSSYTHGGHSVGQVHHCNADLTPRTTSTWMRAAALRTLPTASPQWMASRTTSRSSWTMLARTHSRAPMAWSSSADWTSAATMRARSCMWAVTVAGTRWVTATDTSRN